MSEELKAMEDMVAFIMEFVINYGFQVLGAFIVLIIGFVVASWLGRLVTRFCENRHLDITLSKFFGNMVKIIVLAFALIIALGKFGISIAPFIAVGSAIAFGASFAIQGPLSNYGAGLAIIISRPFVIGNTITVKGVSGVVEDIKLATTVLITEDGEHITIPNKHFMGEILTNSYKYRVVEQVVGVSYDDDPHQAVLVVQKALKDSAGVATDKPPQVGIQNFGDSSVDIGMRYWVPTEKYFQTMFAANQAVWDALKEAGLTIPFPQRDVHLVSGVKDQANAPA